MAEVTTGFRGDVGVVPRQFLRAFVTQMDSSSTSTRTTTRWPRTGFAPVEASAEEQHAIDGTGLEPVSDDVEAPTPREDVW